MQMRAISVTLVLAGVSLAACAQRGGLHSGPSGRSTGFTSHGAPAFHGSPTFAGRTSFTNRSQLNANRYDLLRSDHGVSDRHARLGYSDHRYGNDRERLFRRPYRSFYSFAEPYSVGWIGPSYLGYDPSFYDSTTSSVPQPPASRPSAEQDATPMAQASAPSASNFRPEYQRPTSVPDAPLTQNEAAVTLVFEDGRPTEQIRNYLLTRKILYVQEKHLREIPVDQLDLAATEKLNRETGVDFRLPRTTQ